MTAREIASLWIIAVVAVFIIVWDHRNQAGVILNALTGGASSSGGPSPIVTSVASNLGTNDPMPMAGNEFGALATRGNFISGDVQPGGPDKAFGSIFDNLAGQDYAG